MAGGGAGRLPPGGWKNSPEILTLEINHTFPAITSFKQWTQKRHQIIKRKRFPLWLALLKFHHFWARYFCEADLREGFAREKGVGDFCEGFARAVGGGAGTQFFDLTGIVPSIHKPAPNFSRLLSGSPLSECRNGFADNSSALQWARLSCDPPWEMIRLAGSAAA